MAVLTVLFISTARPTGVNAPTIPSVDTLVIINGNTLEGYKNPSPKPLQWLVADFDGEEDTSTVLNRLAACESGDRWDIRAWDEGSWSYGGLQFKLPTFHSYGIKYGILPKDLPLYEAENRIYEKETQMAIAEKMIENNEEWNWKICWEKVKNGY